MAARDLETEASWKTVSASTASSLPTSRTPNPPLKVRASSWTTATAMPGTPDCRRIVSARSGRRSTARAARSGVMMPGASTGAGSSAGGLASWARSELGRPLAAPRPTAARPAPARVSARRRVSGRLNAIVPDSAEGLFMSTHLPFHGTPGAAQAAPRWLYAFRSRRPGIGNLTRFARSRVGCRGRERRKSATSSASWDRVSRQRQRHDAPLPPADGPP